MEKENNTEIGNIDISHKIFVIRGQKVMVDMHISELYGVKTKVLIQAVKRNKNRFPNDFCFKLTSTEAISLRSQFVTSKRGRGGQRYLPHVFTEHGVSMLSSVLRSERAVQMNIFIIRAFIKLRKMLLENKDLNHKIIELEHVQEKQGEKLDQINKVVIQLIGAKAEPKDHIGFNTDVE